MRLNGTKALRCLVRDQPNWRTAARSSEESPRAAASSGSSVEPLNLDSELARHGGQLAERARDRAQRDAFERLAKIGDGGVEALPGLGRAATRSGSRAQLVRELHVARARTRTMRQAKQVGVAQGLLLGRVGDRPHSLREPLVGRRLDARLERIAPPLVSELDLFERYAGIIGHDGSLDSTPTVMMWSAICLGAWVRAGSLGASPDEALASWRAYAGPERRTVVMQVLKGQVGASPGRRRIVAAPRSILTGAADDRQRAQLEHRLLSSAADARRIAGAAGAHPADVQAGGRRRGDRGTESPVV
jgi:hypothetical protein